MFNMNILNKSLAVHGIDASFKDVSECQTGKSLTKLPKPFEVLKR